MVTILSEHARAKQSLLKRPCLGIREKLDEFAFQEGIILFFKLYDFGMQNCYVTLNSFTKVYLKIHSNRVNNLKQCSAKMTIKIHGSENFEFIVETSAMQTNCQSDLSDSQYTHPYLNKSYYL